MEYVTENQATAIIEFVENEIKKAKKSKVKGFSLKEIANLVYYHFNKNTLFRLFSIEYMKSKMGYENNLKSFSFFSGVKTNVIYTFNNFISKTLTSFPLFIMGLFVSFSILVNDIQILSFMDNNQLSFIIFFIVSFNLILALYMPFIITINDMIKRG